ncbi:glycosyl hydrolase, partial [Pseudomonas sp. CrR25]|nr:glycosyl hydrolase [Pseudomonas sp. CrR25]
MIGKFSVSRVLPAGLVLALLVAPSAVAAESAPTLQIPLLEQAAMQTAKGQRSVLLAVTRAGARLVAVGERGIILLSDDSGTSWRQARVPVSVSLTAVQFIDAEHGWAVGHLGVVLHTADGGETWVKQLDGVRAAQLALASARSSGDAKRMKEAEWLVADGPDKPFLDLHFSDRQNGYVVGAYNLILHTADGGESWQPWMGHVENPEGLNLYSIRAAAGLLFIAGERGLLLRSVDNGQSFQALNAPYDGSFFGLLASATGELVAYGLRGNAYWSGDQGDSWRRIETGVEVALSSGARLNDGSLLLASQSGELLISRDQGR